MRPAAATRGGACPGHGGDGDALEAPRRAGAPAGAPDGTGAHRLLRCRRKPSPHCAPAPRLPERPRCSASRPLRAHRGAALLLLCHAAARSAGQPVCSRFTQYNSQREGNANLEDEYRSISNAADCSAQCAVTQGCACFSYNQDNERCFLMSSCKTPTPRHNFIAGDAGCKIPDPSPETCRVTVSTATPGAKVLRMKWQHGAGRLLHKAADCAGGGALFKVEWKGGVRNDYRVGCRHATTELFHASCASEELLAQWEALVQQEAEEREATLIVYLPEVPELTGVYRVDGHFRHAPMWRSDDCNNGGLGCVLFSSGGGFWMISPTPDGHERNVGNAKSEEQHQGAPPQNSRWQVLTGRSWGPSAGAVDTEAGMRRRGIDWKQGQAGEMVVFLPELPSLTGTYRVSSRFRNTQLFRSSDCATGSCVMFLSGGGFWMVSGRSNGHELNTGVAKTAQMAEGSGPDSNTLQWEWHDRQGWRQSAGAVLPVWRMQEQGWSLRDASITVAIFDVPEVGGTYKVEGRYNGLPLYRSDDCAARACSIFASSSGHWVIADRADGQEQDLGRARGKQRIPHWKTSEGGKPVAEPGTDVEWEGQPELEPHAVQEWDYRLNSGSWRTCQRSLVATTYMVRKRSAEQGVEQVVNF
eukprot:TRINITY_DN1111_c0_g1_i1.p1 TRINITY_DN1111_c0_g1~~TRINITY_DN1111_c0_g1_i1.p1  ORF type:complete len:662 (+),score=206.35 TRINITY_DN1111_c0_g1_i1:66-1988(+)